MKLTLDIINNFNLKKETIRPDWDDVGYEFTLPCGIKLVGFFMLNGSPCETNCLEGVDGYIYIETKEELTDLVSMSDEQIFNQIKSENPEFNIDEWL